jgi:hypothetical protein
MTQEMRSNEVPCILYLIQENQFYDCTDWIRTAPDPSSSMLIWSKYTPKQRNMWRLEYQLRKQECPILMWINTLGTVVRQEVFVVTSEHYSLLLQKLKNDARLVTLHVANEPIFIHAS